MRRLLLIPLAAALLSGPSHAQDFSQTYVFGDSSVDSGWWEGAFAGQCDGVIGPCTPALTSTQKTRLIARAIAEGSNGAPVGAGSLTNAQLLAGYFGLAADPANQPGGTNYAIPGSTNSDATGGKGNVNQNPLLPSTGEQIGNYLAANGGVADASALYLISSGGNDISYIRDKTRNDADRRAFLDQQADALIASVATLSASGARYFVVDSNHGAGGPGTLGEFYTQQLWTGLAAAGINFVPADISAMVRGVQADPERFGFTAATVQPGVVNISTGTSTGSACVIQLGAGGPTDGWGQWCVNTTTPSSNYAYLASADAQQRYFYSDDQHFSAAGQKIEADYVYSLIVAPSQISMLAESAVATRTALVDGIQRQIEASWAHQGGNSFNAWVSGGVAELQTSSSSGFPEGSGRPSTLSGGLSYHIAPSFIVGAAVSTGRVAPDWEADRGGFTQTESSASLYAAFRGPALWADIVGTYGALDYQVARDVPLGISGYANRGETDGDNWSAGARAGYDFQWNGVATGPIAGLLWQRAGIDGFTEAAGNFTSLGFDDQLRDSVVTTLGWRAKLALGAWQPFAEAAWHHEFASSDRDVSAFLTSSSYAPAYSMPAAAPGKDWGTATLGTTLDLGGGVLALGSARMDVGDGGALSYGAQLGLNVGF